MLDGNLFKLSGVACKIVFPQSMVSRPRAVKGFTNRPLDMCTLSAGIYPIDVLLFRESESLGLPPHVCVTWYR